MQRKTVVGKNMIFQKTVVNKLKVKVIHLVKGLEKPKLYKAFISGNTHTHL